MRVISQDGMIDVPYELTAIRTERETVLMCMAGNTGKGSILATYSTEAKAIKAMEMLREAYAGKMIFLNIDLSDEALEMLENWKIQGLSIANSYQKPRFEYISNTVFQFPKDDEIEVENQQAVGKD